MSWTSTKIEMPKPGRRVLLALPNGRVGEGFLRDLRPDSKARSWWIMDGFNCDVPTHWQPLPDPPALKEPEDDNAD